MPDDDPSTFEARILARLREEEVGGAESAPPARPGLLHLLAALALVVCFAQATGGARVPEARAKMKRKLQAARWPWAS